MKVRARHALLAVVFGAAWLSAGASCPTPEKSSEPRGLAFAPVEEATYHMRVREQEYEYRSRIEFQRRDEGGWRARETHFAQEGVGDVPDMTGAALVWRLDDRGIPREVELKKAGSELQQRPRLLYRLSVFAFWPMVAPKQPADRPDSWSALWRLPDRQPPMMRRCNYGMQGFEGETAEISVECRTQLDIEDGLDRVWRREGDVSVSRTDGFSVSGTLQVRGPRAPDADVYESDIEVRRNEPFETSADD